MSNVPLGAKGPLLRSQPDVSSCGKQRKGRDNTEVSMEENVLRMKKTKGLDLSLTFTQKHPTIHLTVWDLCGEDVFPCPSVAT